MGFFSWRTSDTKRSICNVHSVRKTFTVHMVTENRRIYTEEAYQGYGEFGGKDVYVLIGELNGCPHTEEEDIRNWTFPFLYEPDYHTFAQLAKQKINVPKFVETLPVGYKKMSNHQWREWWKSLSYPRDCRAQGYFYSK